MEQRLAGKIIRGFATLWAFLAFGTANVSLLRAQAAAGNWEKAAGGKMSFDIASVKRDKDASADPQSNMDLGPMDSFSPTGGLLQASNVPLIRYIAFAYKLSPEEVKLGVQPQLPKWANTSDYDIVARASGNPTKDQLRLMVQALLADRFNLLVHYETKQMPVLALLPDKPGKLGPRLREHIDDGVPCTTVAASGGKREPTITGGFPVQCGTVVHFPGKTSGVASLGARALASSILADVLGVSYQTDKPVVDDTGLGLVDFLLEFTPDRMTNTGRVYDPDAPTFDEALKEQLGLKFESRAAPVQLMIIDHIEQPLPN
jgi:bla regulator protein BlaR1